MPSSASGSPSHPHVLVTGAGSGIGRAIALRLARDGASLSLLGRRRDALEATARDCVRGGAPATFVASCDVREPAAIQRHVGEAAAALGPIQAGVANAGVGGPNRSGDEDRWDELISTNLSGTYHTFRAVQRHLAGGPSVRHLVAMSSILGRIGVPAYSGYCASKSGILGLVRALAAELAKDGVQVNALCPGWVDTDMAWDGLRFIAKATKRPVEEAHREAMAAVPTGRMSRPEDVANLVAWLISEEARGITGQGIDINNGAWMG
jgi:NAD(P)-dependent dehydrogenase (short-subunit alcohol dehydrogenase family)